MKELRQAVRNRTVAGAFLLFLLASVAIVSMSLISASSDDLTRGRDVFMMLSGTLFFACLFFVPSYAAARLSMERGDANTDLFFITTIRPLQVVIGKFLAGSVVALVIFSACLPFLLFSYLLRGVDIPSMAVVLGFQFMLVLTALLAALLVACVPTSRGFKSLLGLGLAGGLFAVFSGATTASYQMLRSGVGSSLGTWGFWGPAVLIILSCAGTAGLCLTAATGLLSPGNANRTVRLRIYLTEVWLVSGVAAVLWALLASNGDILAAWGFINAICLGGLLFLAVSEKDYYTARVRRGIPRSLLGRLFAFPFYSAGAGGVLWVACLFALTVALLLAVCASGLMVHSPIDPDVFAGMIAGWLYALCYSLTALRLRRWFLKGRDRIALTWALGMGVLTLAMGVPAMLYAVLHNQGVVAARYDRSFFQLGNVFALDDHGIWLQWHLLVATVWGLAVLALNATWFIRQVRDYRNGS